MQSCGGVVLLSLFLGLASAQQVLGRFELHDKGRERQQQCGPAGCAPFSPADTRTSASYTNQRPCFDVNLSVQTMYQFKPVPTSTTLTSIFESLSTIVTTEVSTVTTEETSLPTTFTRTSTNVSTPTTVTTTVTTTIPTTLFSVTELITTTTQTIESTLITSFATTLTTAAISIGTGPADWSFYREPCSGQLFDGDGNYSGSDELTLTNLSRPLFIASNERFRLYPCETFQVGGTFTFSSQNQVNVTSPFGYAADPAYGSGLMGVFDDESGFSFYWIFTPNRAYAMYSRVPAWCPCSNPAGNGACGPRECRRQDIEDDLRYPKPTVTGTTTTGGVNPCACTFCTLPTLRAKANTAAPTAVPAVEKYGFDYYSFTYLIPLAYLQPGQVENASISLNSGKPSVTWFLGGQALLTIPNPGTPIDPKFLLAQYGAGSLDYAEMPRQVQMALGLLPVTESTQGRSACQGGVFNSCYQGAGSQTIDDARFTYCVYAPPQLPGTYQASLAMEVGRLGVTRISKAPRPCCPS